MGTAIGRAIADAGPLIHLYEVNSLDALQVFPSVAVPEVVWRETVGKGRVSVQGLEALPNLARVDLDPDAVGTFVEQHSLQHLQAGEQACLALMDRRNADLIVTDDLGARDAARGLDRRPVGSLGVIVRFFREGYLPLSDAVERLRALQHDSTLFVTPEIVDMAIEQLQKRA